METKSNLFNPCQKVRDTCQNVVNSSKNQFVTINQPKISEFLVDLEKQIRNSKNEQLAYDKWCDWHIDNPKQYSIEQITAYCFVVDSMNFCFWPNNPSGEFEYDSMTRNLEKVLINDPQFFTCDRLIEVTEDWLREHVFANNSKFCLVNERARILNEVGYVIKTEFDSSFYEFVKRANFSCPKFVEMIVKHFSGYRDEAIYNGDQIFFYKRAQILCSDLIGAWSDVEHEQKFSETAELTMFADYRVPQILRHVDIFEYSKDLAEKIDQEQELLYSSQEEVEIRAATVVAVENIICEIRKNDYLNKRIDNSYEVDWLLWQMGEKKLSEMKPHHKVLSIFY